MTPTQEVLEQMIAIEQEDRVPVGIYCGKPWFEQLVAEIYPDRRHDDLVVEVLPGLKARYEVVEKRRQEDIRRAMGSWGKEGTMLFGIPVHPRSALGNEVEVR